MQRNIGVIIPTLGNRHELLSQAIESALNCDVAFVAIISPQPMPPKLQKAASGRCQWYQFNDGLPESINFGFQLLPDEVQYVTWLGDDDLLDSEGFANLRILPGVDLLVGACRYISNSGKSFTVRKVSRWRITAWALSLFASPIAQPATLFSRRFIELTGGIDNKYRLAFDQDFFTRGISLGARVQVTDQTLASYRVHDDTLSNKHWVQSMEESGRIRLSLAPRYLSTLSKLLQFLRMRAVQLQRDILLED